MAQPNPDAGPSGPLYDPQALAIQRAYDAAVQANSLALSVAAIDRDVQQRFNALISRCDGVVARANSLVAASGTAKDVFLRQILAVGDALRAQLVQAEADAAALVRDTLASVAPDLPASADTTQVGYTRQDVLGVLEAADQQQRQSVAAGLLSDALASGDAVVPALLIGEGPMSLQLAFKRLPGVQVDALRRQYLDAKVAASPSGTVGRGLFANGVPPVARFVQLQDDPARNLAAVVGYAGDLYDYQRGVVSARLATPVRPAY